MPQHVFRDFRNQEFYKSYIGRGISAFVHSSLASSIAIDWRHTKVHSTAMTIVATNPPVTAKVTLGDSHINIDYTAGYYKSKELHKQFKKMVDGLVRIMKKDHVIVPGPGSHGGTRRRRHRRRATRRRRA